ncbi:MAG: hypothetical protein EPN36_09220 [Rhodanobacteraceae bacterium]|nr:MAG: hypothetical protein EPN36_09220 [Rhodanobacteraceae bacterium]
MGTGFPDNRQLLEWAGEQALLRGHGYYSDGRISLTQATESSLTGEAYGSETYGLWLRREGKQWTWHCDCPAADGGVFCKHLVAAVLTARKEDSDAGDAEGESAPAAARQPGELLAFLRAQPVERLSGWLHELALEDRDIEKRLLLYRAAEQPDALKTALGKLFNTGGWLDYHGAIRYARRLDAAIEQLRDVLQRDPAECRALCEYALKRLIKVYDGGADDSAGAIGECLREIAALYADACKAAKPDKALAKTLYPLVCADGWELLSLADFWDALGAAGQADYAKRVLAEFERLPPARPDNRYDESFGVCRRTEELARCAGDFELLQRVLRRDLTHAWDHLRVLESLREFGRDREALAWAEAAVKKFPEDSRLRAALAECLADAGMGEEALQQVWQNFLEHSVDGHWDALKRLAGGQWPAWRQRALEAVAKLETERRGGAVSTRIMLLLHDGDLDTALQLARAKPVALHVLLVLAGEAKHKFPADAGAFYLRVAQAQAEALNSASDYKRLVANLSEASKLLQVSEWRPLVAHVRELHRRKPKLMGMLDKASL